VLVDGFPLSSNGKVDRRELEQVVAASTNLTPDQAFHSPDARVAALSPAKRALLERKLAAKTAKPGNQADSASRIAQLSPAKRALLEAKRRGAAAPTRAPLSSAQERLWVLDRMYPGTANYSITKAHTLRGPLDVDALRRACDLVAARHDILRTRYLHEDGEPFQQVDPPGPAHFALVDLSEWEGDT